MWIFSVGAQNYSANFIIERIEGRGDRVLRQAFLELREWCKSSLWVPSCYHGNVVYGWEIVEIYIDNKTRNRDAEGS